MFWTKEPREFRVESVRREAKNIKLTHNRRSVLVVAKKWSSSIQLIANITLFAVENAKVKVDLKKINFSHFPWSSSTVTTDAAPSLSCGKKRPENRCVRVHVREQQHRGAKKIFTPMGGWCFSLKIDERSEELLLQEILVLCFPTLITGWPLLVLWSNFSLPRKEEGDFPTRVSRGNMIKEWTKLPQCQLCFRSIWLLRPGGVV